MQIGCLPQYSGDHDTRIGSGREIPSGISSP
jgi:hypothetical protein